MSTRQHCAGHYNRTTTPAAQGALSSAPLSATHKIRSNRDVSFTVLQRNPAAIGEAINAGAYALSNGRAVPEAARAAPRIKKSSFLVDCVLLSPDSIS